MKKIILVKFALTVFLSIFCNLTFSQFKADYFGINLAGAEFGQPNGIYDKDYSYPNTEELEYYNSKGLKLIRLPLKWERLQPVLGKSLDSTELNRVLLLIDEADRRGMYVIPDIHNYGRRNIEGIGYIIGSPEVSVNDIKYFWREFADALRKKKNIWGYGLMNEPHDMLSSPTWPEIAQEIIDGIREKDKHTTIIVGGNHWSSAHKWKETSENLKFLKDPSGNLIFEAHVYFDKDNSGTYRSSYDTEESYSNVAVDRIKPFISWLKENKLKGFLGEYGVPANDERWLVALDNLLKYMKDNGINGTYWAGGPRWREYPLSIEPVNGKDKPQMLVVQKYLKLD